MTSPTEKKKSKTSGSGGPKRFKTGQPSSFVPNQSICTTCPVQTNRRSAAFLSGPRRWPDTCRTANQGRRLLVQAHAQGRSRFCDVRLSPACHPCQCMLRHRCFLPARGQPIGECFEESWFKIPSTTNLSTFPCIHCVCISLLSWDAGRAL